MSLSRLIGLVSVLVLGTLVSVWWYLQVPDAGFHGAVSGAKTVEPHTGEISALRSAPPAASTVAGEIPRGPLSGAPVFVIQAPAIQVPALPSSVAPTPSGRWTRRLAADPLTHTARARRAALQGATPAEYMRGIPVPTGPTGPEGAAPASRGAGACAGSAGKQRGATSAGSDASRAQS